MAEDKKVEAKGDYTFAVNPLKLQRAVAETTRENGGAVPADDVVKERYVKLGGLLAAEEEATTAKPRAVMAPKTTLAEVKARKK